MNPNDPRVIRTRQMLREALVALIIERGYDAISIADIADKAGLRRATFYLHYRSKEELLLNLLRETVDEFIQNFQVKSDDPFGKEHQQRENCLTFEFVKARANLYRAILSGQGAAQATRAVREHLAARIRERHLREKPGASLPVEVLANYLAAVKLNMIIWWLEQDMPYPPQEMASMVTQLTRNGTRGLLEMA